MGKRSIFSRLERDNYETPASAVRPLLPWLVPQTRFVEPCSGSGKLIDHLVHAGHIVAGAYDWPDNDARVARYDIPAGAVIITNPPFWGLPPNLHRIIVNLSDQAPAWLLLSADWAHNVSSGELLRQRCRLIVSVGRVRWIPRSEFTGKDNAAWYLFERPSAGMVTRFVGRAA
jgi:hypothetical protein